MKLEEDVGPGMDKLGWGRDYRLQTSVLVKSVIAFVIFVGKARNAIRVSIE